MTTSDDANAIRTQMAQIRNEVDEDMEGIIGSARTLTDWHYYVQTYPWACVAAAVTLGYLLAPRRNHVVRLDARTMAKLTRGDREVVREEPAIERKSLIRSAAALLAGMATRGALAYAERNAGQFLKERFASRTAAPQQPEMHAP